MRLLAGLAVGFCLLAPMGAAAAPAPWLGVGPEPCKGPDEGTFACGDGSRGPVAILAGKLFDSVAGTVLRDQVILIEGERIKTVSPRAQTVIPKGATVVDLRSEMVLPGLIDTHTHIFNHPKPGATAETAIAIAVHNMQVDLDAGFTTLRDVSSHGNGYADVDLRNAVNAGLITGPRLQVAGRSLGWEGSQPPAAPDPRAVVMAASVGEGLEAIDREADHGADWIKFYTSTDYKFSSDGAADFPAVFPSGALSPLIAEAHRRGKKTACHAFGGAGLAETIAAGCDTIEHGASFSQANLDEMSRRGLVYSSATTRYLTPAVVAADRAATGGKFSIIPIFQKTLRMAVATPGLTIAFGSGVDGILFPHGEQAYEFETLTKIGGMTNIRALQSATIVNAKVMGWSNEIGSVSPGKYADIVAVAGDPTANMGDIRRVDFVMKGGKVIRGREAAGAKRP